jgi:energy-coupling factor transporter ATP-binding protein EcfA2
MANYDFSTLNSTDLEELASDLMNFSLPKDSLIKYKTFKEGKDQGIDFLYSTEQKLHEHVGQVKHYYRTGYNGLITALKKTEVDKVVKLDPNKYIFITSVDLNVANTKEIHKIFSPYIKNLNDVYGKNDLNRLIEENENILDIHYKLWLSDFSILAKILNSDLEFRSTILIESELKRRLRIYVKTPLLESTRVALKKNKFIVITGEPGVGKTTLAEMLVYEYIAEGYKLTYIIDDIREAEKALVLDDSKQIIYFDDFLGSNEVEINKAKGSETRLRKILRSIDAMENKLIVFTTRTFLLNTAIEESENLKRFNIKAKSSLFHLDEYNIELKKQLLNNHIENSGLNDELKEIINSIEIQKFIIKHPNYAPRSVEFITSKEIVGGLDIEQYKEFIKNSFNYPDEIWKHAYSHQIKEDDRLLLNTLLSFGKSAKLTDLENAFISRLNLEIRTNNKKKEMLAFNKSLKRLDGGFLKIKKNKYIDFINPSLIDFLLDYIKLDQDEVMRITESIISVSQLTARLFAMIDLNKVKIPINLQERLVNEYDTFIDFNNQDYDLIQLAIVIYKYVDQVEKDDVICEIINEINDWESLHSNYSLNIHFREFLDSVRGNYKINLVLEERIMEIVTDLVLGEQEVKAAINTFKDLINSFDLDINFIDTSDITQHFDEIFSDLVANEAEMLKEWILDESEVYDKVNELEGLSNEIVNLGLDFEPNMDEMAIDWYDTAMNNEIQRLIEKDD